MTPTSDPARTTALGALAAALRAALQDMTPGPWIAPGPPDDGEPNYIERVFDDGDSIGIGLFSMENPADERGLIALRNLVPDVMDALGHATRDLVAAQAENDALARLVCEWSEAARHLGWTPAYRAPADAGAERTGP